MDDEFARFEHESWQRVAAKYHSVWSSPTRQFIPSLLADASVSAGMLVLDIACGLGYVRTAGILLRQSPETLGAIRIAIENGIKQYARGNEFVLPMAAHVVVVSKR